MARPLKTSLPMAKAVSIKIRDWLQQQRIETGTYLPPERELAEKFQTSRITARQAVNLLAGEGWVTKKANSRPQVARLSPAPDARPSSPIVAPDGPTRIGVLVHNESDAYGLQVIRHLFAAAGELPLELDVAYVSDFLNDSLNKAEMLKQGGCGAVIVPWIPKLSYGDVAMFLLRSPLPASVPVYLPGLEKFCIEEKSSGRDGTEVMVNTACRYFMKLGYRHLALLGPDSVDGEIMNRHLMAYTRFLCQAKLPSLCGFPGYLAKDMDAVAAEWSEHAPDLAVLCYDDEHAGRFMSAMHKLGLGAPRDYAIIGCNDTPQCLSMDPPLSSFRFDYSLLAQQLLDVALHHATGAPRQPCHKTPPVLIVRESCGGAERLGGNLAEAMRELNIPHHCEITSA